MYWNYSTLILLLCLLFQYFVFTFHVLNGVIFGTLVLIAITFVFIFNTFVFSFNTFVFILITLLFIFFQYFNQLGLDEEERKRRMAHCRHKARFAPPDTPEHYWSIGFPDTQECEDRGYLNTTQARPSKARRKRPLKKLFKARDSVAPNDGKGGERDVSDFSD